MKLLNNVCHCTLGPVQNSKKRENIKWIEYYLYLRIWNLNWVGRYLWKKNSLFFLFFSNFFFVLSWFLLFKKKCINFFPMLSFSFSLSLQPFSPFRLSHFEFNPFSMQPIDINEIRALCSSVYRYCSDMSILKKNICFS